MLLTSLNSTISVLRPVEFVVATLYAKDPIVEAPYAIPSAVDAVVEIPGMPALIRTSEAIVDTCVETTLLRPMKAPVRVLRDELVVVAIPRAVDAVVEIPGMPAVVNANPLIVDT